MSNTIVKTYSELARQYDDDKNLASCWGKAATDIAKTITLRPGDRVIADVGCGTGQALAELAERGEDREFIGLEPAEGMRERAAATTQAHSNVRIIDGSFENLPLDDNSVDYMFSIFAFHWTTDVEAAVAEVARVLKPAAAMDLHFIGRRNGREFIRATTPIFLRHLGAKGLLEAASMRKQLTLDQAHEVFATALDASRLEVEESLTTYYDTLEGHWGWWVRIEGQFVQIPADRKAECDEQVRNALASLKTDEGIPYTLHKLHVKLT